MRYLLTMVSVLCLTFSSAQTLVVPGDFPDPSAVKIGNTYWSTATTSNWAPAFPLYSSDDLIHWETKGYVFPTLPAWADYYFWAPEMSFENGRTYVYYSAHKRDGNMCVAVASADNPGGPYRDHGPLICQEAGSIDAWPMRDENGKLYLIWKEDGNSVKLPTPIWAAEMNEARTELIGEKQELFRNDAEWEGNLVEGVSMIRHGDYIYAFYAGAGCCGRGCSYGIGVARAKKLLGPWEKYPGNPVVATNEDWKCAGHGTPVVKDGRFFFMYHAYEKESSVYAGRQGVLSEFTFTQDGWIEFLNSPDISQPIQPEVMDGFEKDTLSDHWQWSVFQQPRYRLGDGKLKLTAADQKSGSFLGMKTLTANYDVEVTLLPKASSAEVGLALVGDEKNFVAVTLKGNLLVLRKIENDKETMMEERRLPASEKMMLKAEVRDGKDILFSYSPEGKKFTPLNGEPVDGSFLPPWDRAVRAAIIAKGNPSQTGVFEHFILKNR